MNSMDLRIQAHICHGFSMGEHRGAQWRIWCKLGRHLHAAANALKRLEAPPPASRPPMPGLSEMERVENPFNAVWDNQPAKPVSDTAIEIMVVGRRCVYINDYRVAGGKPYYSENLPSFDHKTKIGDVLDAFTDKQIRAYLREKKATRDYFAAYHASRKSPPPSSMSVAPEKGVSNSTKEK